MMKNTSTFRVLAALFALAVLFINAAWTPQSAAAQEPAPVQQWAELIAARQAGSEIDWISPWLCATTRPDVCEDVKTEWSWAAPADGTLTLTVGVQSVNTGPDAAEVLDYEASWGAIGRLGTIGHPSSFETTIEVAEDEEIWVHFVHPPTTPGGSVQATVRGHFEPTPPPVEPVCSSWSVSPTSGYAPLSVVGSGSYSDPDGLVEEIRVLWGDGSVTTNPIDLDSVPHSYGVGTYTSQLVLVKADGGLVTSAACSATVEAVEPPTFDLGVDISCQDQILSGRVYGFASQEATLKVTAEVFGAALGGSQQVGPGSFNISAQKAGIEGLIWGQAAATLTHQGEVVKTAEFSEMLDCGLPPQPEPGSCVSAAVSVANVPDSGAWVVVTAQVVGDLAEVSVNGQPAGQTVPVNGTTSFEVFVRPDDTVSVAALGEDGEWATSPACQLTITGVPERCPSSFVTTYVYFDQSGNGLWEAGSSIPTLGTLDWASAGEPGLNGVQVVVPTTNSGSFSGTTQPNGWAFTSTFYSSTFFAQPTGGYASNGSPLPFVVNDEAWEVSGVATLATDGTGIQTPVTSWPLEEGGHCGARVFLIGLVPAAQPAAEAAPAWGGNAPADHIAVGAPVVGSVNIGGRTVGMTEVWGSQTSDWHQCGLRRDRQLIGCHVTDNAGNVGPGTALLSHQVGDTITVMVDGVTTSYVVTGRQTVDRGPDWANRLDAVEAAAGGSAMTFFTCSGWNGSEYTSFTVLTTAPAG